MIKEEKSLLPLKQQRLFIIINGKTLVSLKKGQTLKNKHFQGISSKKILFKHCS